MNKIRGKTSLHIMAEVGIHKPGEMNKKETGIAFIKDTPGVEIRIIFIVIEIACDLRQISRRLQGSSEKAFNWVILQVPNCGEWVSQSVPPEGETEISPFLFWAAHFAFSIQPAAHK